MNMVKKAVARRRVAYSPMALTTESDQAGREAAVAGKKGSGQI